MVALQKERFSALTEFIFVTVPKLRYCQNPTKKWRRRYRKLLSWYWVNVCIFVYLPQSHITQRHMVESTVHTCCIPSPSFLLLCGVLNNRNEDDVCSDMEMLINHTLPGPNKKMPPGLGKQMGKKLLLHNFCMGDYLSPGNTLFNPKWCNESLLIS